MPTLIETATAHTDQMLYGNSQIPTTTQSHFSFFPEIPFFLSSYLPLLPFPRTLGVVVLPTPTLTLVRDEAKAATEKERKCSFFL